MNPNMIPRIHLLNRLLANQIAAGEVVERPAAVVKELLENSIDAHAQQIEVHIQQGGFHLIKVRDDGCGIEQSDLRLAVCRHATSKISTVEDLATIDSLGFRGEALASIAAVSRFWMSSKPAQQAQAWQVHLNGLDTEVELQPTAHPAGTTVMVQDLFFNTPARRKFLRSERTEYLQIEEIFKRIALSQLDIGFSLTHNQRMIYRLLPATTATQQQRRVAKIFGGQFIENACQVDIHATDLTLTGWIGLPSISRSQNDLQYIYLNGRLVRDRVINHALRQAYEDLLPPGRNALYVLYLTISPTMVDVNVHPTKHEVRFHQARLVHDFLVSAVRKALQQVNVGVSEIAKPYVMPDMTENKSNLCYVAEPEVIYEAQTAAITTELSTESKQENQSHTWGKAINFLQDRWLLSEINEGILFIDTHAAQRFLCEKRLLQAYENHSLESQTLLFPYTHTLTGNLLTQLLSQREELQAAGIVIDQLSQNSIIIRALPQLLTELDSYAFLLALSTHLQQHRVLDANTALKRVSQFIKPQSLTTLAQQQSFLSDLSVYVHLTPALPAFCYHMSYQELATTCRGDLHL
jgi:DNA mismatch repair protein MutL